MCVCAWRICVREWPKLWVQNLGRHQLWRINMLAKISHVKNRKEIRSVFQKTFCHFCHSNAIFSNFNPSLNCEFAVNPCPILRKKREERSLPEIWVGKKISVLAKIFTLANDWERIFRSKNSVTRIFWILIKRTFRPIFFLSKNVSTPYFRSKKVSVPYSPSVIYNHNVMHNNVMAIIIITHVMAIIMPTMAYHHPPLFQDFWDPLSFPDIFRTSSPPKKIRPSPPPSINNGTEILYINKQLRYSQYWNFSYRTQLLMYNSKWML